MFTLLNTAAIPLGFVEPYDEQNSTSNCATCSHCSMPHANDTYTVPGTNLTVRGTSIILTMDA